MNSVTTFCSVDGCRNFASKSGCQNNCITICNYHSSGVTVSGNLLWHPNSQCGKCSGFIYPEQVRNQHHPHQEQQTTQKNNIYVAESPYVDQSDTLATTDIIKMMSTI